MLLSARYLAAISLFLLITTVAAAPVADANNPDWRQKLARGDPEGRRSENDARGSPDWRRSENDARGSPDWRRSENDARGSPDWRRLEHARGPPDWKR